MQEITGDFVYQKILDSDGRSFTRICGDSKPFIGDWNRDGEDINDPGTMWRYNE